MYWLVFLFFFSSRRRHTRCLSDWSSDVCSSDLESVGRGRLSRSSRKSVRRASTGSGVNAAKKRERSEEHTSELQSLRHLVCRLLLEKKKKKKRKKEDQWKIEIIRTATGIEQKVC